MLARNRTLLAWLLFVATFGCLAAGLVVAVLPVRPLTASVLVQGAIEALVFRLSFAAIGLVLTLRRPANPIGWLYAAAGLVWSLEVPGTPWVDQLARAYRPLPLAAQVAALVADVAWVPAVALGVTLPLLLLPDGRLRSPRWRPVAVASVCGAVLVVAGGLAPGPLTDPPIPNPLALAGWAGMAATIADARGRARGKPGGGAGLRGAAVPRRPRRRAAAAPLGRRRRRHRRRRAAGGDRPSR